MSYPFFGVVRQTLFSFESSKMSLAANTVGYKIYSSALKDLDDFRNVKREIMEFIQPWISDYLWHIDEFVLKISKKKYFFGTCKFGDNVEDEWFISWLLFQISQQFRDLCITLQDEDGQFLLITAAPALPEWVCPEVVKNRVFLKGGRLHLIPPTYSCPDLKVTSKFHLLFLLHDQQLFLLKKRLAIIILNLLRKKMVNGGQNSTKTFDEFEN